jgi:putative transposase
MRHTTFRFCLDPSAGQQVELVRHAGAARFGYNVSLRLVKDSLTARQRHPGVKVPWSGFDLINQFNVWKKTEAAGRVIAVNPVGDAEIHVTGLAWRGEVCQQVFEEAAVDLGRALAAFTASRRSVRKGHRVGFPRFKRKGRSIESFRLRNNYHKGGLPPIRVGDGGIARSVVLPGIGMVRLHDDTRRLRRLVATGRGRILFAAVSRRAGRWYVALNVEAADLNEAARHRPSTIEATGHVGVDLGLHALAVVATADGVEVGRFDHPRHLNAAMGKQVRLARAVTRKQNGSSNRQKAAAKLGRHHQQVKNRRHYALHKVANAISRYPRVALEDLNVVGMLRNHQLARVISDAAWAELGRILTYKQQWRGGRITVVDRWFPSTKTCSSCGAIDPGLTLGQRIYRCPACGLTLDRDLNAAINLAAWADAHAARDREATGPDTNACGEERSDRRIHVGATILGEAGTLTRQCEGTPEKGAVGSPDRL